MKRASILLVGNDPTYPALLKDHLLEQRKAGAVYITNHEETALEHVARLQPDVVVVDLIFPMLSGLKTIMRLRQHSPKRTVIIAIALQYTEAYRNAALEAGADAFLNKMNVATDLLQVLSCALSPSPEPSVPPPFVPVGKEGKA